MNERQDHPQAVISVVASFFKVVAATVLGICLLIALAPLVVVLLWLMNEEIAIFSAIAVVSLLSGAGAIRLMIRWVNRLDDPRHIKRPPDSP